jgi:hypothetical protein
MLVRPARYPRSTTLRPDRSAQAMTSRMSQMAPDLSWTTGAGNPLARRRQALTVLAAIPSTWPISAGPARNSASCMCPS